MGLIVPWSVTLLVVDAYSVFIKCLPYQRRIILIIFIGDMVCAVYDETFVILLSRYGNNDIDFLHGRFCHISH